MKEARYFFAPLAGDTSELPQEEAAHAIRVLRLQQGDELFLMDGAGKFFRAEVTMATSKRCFYQIKETLPQQKAWRGHIHLAMAPTKMMERVEWFAEKSTEVGIDRMTFLQCQFSERRVLKTDRLEKIVVSAVKQSRKPWKPAVHGMVPLKEFLSAPRPGGKYIAHCYEEFPRADFFKTLLEDDRLDDQADVTVLIGPEGDFSAGEVRMALDHGYRSVSLGSARLRTETAALYAVMQAQLVKRL